MDDIDIPAFLLIPQADRKAAWKGRAVTKIITKAGRNWRLPLTMDATARTLLREQEAAREVKKQASLAALKQWKLENKR